ncbi:MAG: polysaccharide biosynthesis tyrosine autokinase, partial [Leptolyngbyaceae cyanobacterium bins.59]|nr:polysaccharide biosynthesis tyrosine autokinase [Leptolyngbyaceae cyanobacterium bins.59]
VFLGIMLGVAAAFFVDLIDRSLKTVKEARSIFGYPLLGMIPHFEASNGIELDTVSGISPRVIVASSPRSILHEAYQMLWANLRFTSSDKRVRTIVITSSVPQEGKSEVSANLAATIAQAGRRVLLVDADLRHPSQHHLWDRVNSQGLSNLIAGQGEVSETIQVINSNLSVLTAGAIPPNPSALLDSEAMVALIEQFSQDYDYILLDSPPLAWVADAAVLGKMVDGVVVVVRPGVVNSATATAAKTLLSRSAPNVLGLVANDVDVSHEPDGFFYYSANPSETEAERPKGLSRVTRSLTAR